MEKRHKRPRINIICSSSNYEDSIKKYKKLRTAYIQQFHNNSIEIIEEISNRIVIEPHSISITNHKKAYVKAFGKLIPVPLEKVNELAKTPDIVIIWD